MSNVKSTTQVRALERFSYKRIQGLKYKTVFNNGYSQGITSAQKTFNKISHVAVLRWLPIGAIFLGIIAEVKNAESRFDFCCSGAKSENNHLNRGKCFHLYRKQYTKYGVSVCSFVIINFVTYTIFAIYPQIVGPTVDQPSSSTRNGNPENQSRD